MSAAGEEEAAGCTCRVEDDSCSEKTYGVTICMNPEIKHSLEKCTIQERLIRVSQHDKIVLSFSPQILLRSSSLL